MLKKIGNIIFYTFSAFLLLLVSIEFLFPANSMSIIGFKLFAVPTPSMEPVINVGDMIVVVPANLDNLGEGDIISFYADLNNDGVDEIVTHKIRSIIYEGETRLYKTYGINNNSDDLYRTTDDDLVGTYLFRIRFIGYIVLFLKIMFQNPILLGLITINIFIVIILVKFIKKKPKEETHDLG